jgi:UDP-N-acetylglucosamine transferase subunit ALG13
MNKEEQLKNIRYFNFMTSRQLEQTFNESDIVLARSGYTTIMDLVRLGKAFYPLPANMNNYTWQKNYKKRV